MVRRRGRRLPVTSEELEDGGYIAPVRATLPLDVCGTAPIRDANKGEHGHLANTGNCEVKSLAFSAFGCTLMQKGSGPNHSLIRSG